MDDIVEWMKSRSDEVEEAALFVGKVALITGGSRGLGYAVAAKLNAYGATVIVCGRDNQRLACVRETLADVTTYACDITDPDQLGRMLANINREFGRIDLLVNCARQERPRDFGDHRSLAGISSEIEINLAAPINLLDLAMPLLRRSKSPAVVFVTGGFNRPVGEAPIHAAAREGLKSFAQAVRPQMARLGIRIVELVPPKEVTAPDPRLTRVASASAASALVRMLVEGGGNETRTAAPEVELSAARRAGGCAD